MNKSLEHEIKLNSKRLQFAKNFVTNTNCESLRNIITVRQLSF